MLTNCPINKETLRQAPGLQNWPVRGHWPLRALPGRPLGGGRVLGLHVLGCLLSLFQNSRTRSPPGTQAVWRRRKGKLRKWSCLLPLEQDVPLLCPPPAPHPAAQDSLRCSKHASPPSSPLGGLWLARGDPPQAGRDRLSKPTPRPDAELS